VSYVDLDEGKKLSKRLGKLIGKKGGEKKQKNLLSSAGGLGEGCRKLFKLGGGTGFRQEEGGRGHGTPRERKTTKTEGY